MSVQIRSRSVLPAVLPLFFVAAFTHLPGLAAFAQGQSREESASFKRVKETVSKLLSEPVYTAGGRKAPQQLG